MDRNIVKCVEAVKELHPSWSSTRFYHSADYLLGDVNLDGKTFLDIGGGYGLWSFYAAAAGCDQAVCLEPVAEGSSSQIRRKFNNLKGKLKGYGGEKVKFVKQGLQEFQTENKYDIIFTQNSINHIDEWAVQNIDVSEKADMRYKKIFSTIDNLGRSGSVIVLGDVSSENLWPDLGMSNPFTSQIEWDKHQPPETWINFLNNIGYKNPEVKWYTPAKLRKAFILFPDSWVQGYLYTGHFRVKMKKE